MKIFKTFLIIMSVFFNIPFLVIGSVTFFSFLNEFLPIHNFIGYLPDFLGYPMAYILAFLFYSHFSGLLLYASPLGPISFGLLAFLNAKKSGSKIWYGILIITILLFCIIASIFTYNLLRSIHRQSAHSDLELAIPKSEKAI